MSRTRFPLLLLSLFAISLSMRAMPAKDTISIIFFGDLMIHSAQLKAALIEGADTTLPESYDFSSYFKYTQKYINDADFSVINMETPLGVAPYSGYPVFSAPESILNESIKSGIDLFLCANNHICDKRITGLDRTLANYEALGALHTGVYRNESEEEKNNPLIVDIKGIKVAFINFTYALNGFTVPKPFVVNMRDSVHLKKVIKRAKENKADVIIATPHWGEEYNLSHNSVQQAWRDFLFREGVNIIIGSHPHVIQPVEIKKDEDGKIESVVAYSLGNYISNMSLQNTQMGLLFTLKLTRDEDENIEIVSGESTYLWCARGGKLEHNYTVIPAEEYLDKEDAFIVKSEYDKLKKTLWLLKRK